LERGEESVKNRVTVKIADNEYTIVADETEEYIRKIGGMVNSRMTEMLEANPRMSTLMAAVLCCTNFCDELMKAQNAADNLRAQMKTYLDESAKYRAEADEARREIARLNNEIQSLRAQLSRQQSSTGKSF